MGGCPSPSSAVGVLNLFCRYRSAGGVGHPPVFAPFSSHTSVCAQTLPVPSSAAVVQADTDKLMHPCCCQGKWLGKVRHRLTRLTRPLWAVIKISGLLEILSFALCLLCPCSCPLRVQQFYHSVSQTHDESFTLSTSCNFSSKGLFLACVMLCSVLIPFSDGVNFTWNINFSQ